MAAIEFQGIRKSFGSNKVVAGLDLSIRDDEFVVFLGPSGCGKTTCLRMLAGLEEPTAGRIILGNTDVTAQEPGKRDIAMVFQNYALYPHMTVRENMSTGLRYHRVPRPEIVQRVNAAAQLLDLEALLDCKPAQLSGGQRQRVALGRAIVRRPKAFLMDEPLSNLDATLRARMRVELKMLHQQVGTTTVYVTHDQIEAMTMAERIVVMSGGHLMQFDTPERIFNNPANRFVAEFVGTPGINVVPGRLAHESGAARLAFLGQSLKLAAGHEPKLAEVMARGDVELGVRPQSFALVERDDALHIEGKVIVVEPIGTQTHVHVGAGEANLVVVVDAATKIAVGETLPLWIPRDAIFVFNPSDGRTLSRGV